MGWRRQGAVLMLGSLLSLFGLGGARADTAAEKRVAEIQQMVIDPGQTFSISATLSELRELDPRLGPSTAETLARGQLLYARGYLHFRAGQEEESIVALSQGLKIEKLHGFLSPKGRAYAYYYVANQHELLGEMSEAIEAYRAALPIFEDAALSDDERAAIKEKLAYCLHEDGRFDEAATLNRQVIATGEKLFGAGSPKLLPALTNLAQNAHALGDPVTSRQMLERRMAIARSIGDDAKVEDSLFQLGVLAHETGKPDEARALMRQRLEHAKASGDPRRIEDAEDMIEELERRIAAGEK